MAGAQERAHLVPGLVHPATDDAVDRDAAEDHVVRQVERHLDPTPVITHRFPLEEIDTALEAIASGAAGKVILEIGG
jgi:threonine dehydrogenase-like Zn-dependent dehydrogenase